MSLSSKENRRHVEDAVVYHQLYFQSPLNFNDPFECKTLFSLRGASDSDWRDYFTHRLKRANRTMSEDECRKLAGDVVGKLPLHQVQSFQDDVRSSFAKMQVDLAKRIGILCLTESPSDIVMWAHYADGHKGICLVFDPILLRRICGLARVNYRARYPSFRDYIKSYIKSDIDLMLLNKAAHWKYEREWRGIHVLRQRQRLVRYPRAMLKGVILGCEVSSDMVGLVRGWVAQDAKGRKFPRIS